MAQARTHCQDSQTLQPAAAHVLIKHHGCRADEVHQLQARSKVVRDRRVKYLPALKEAP